MAQPLKQHIKFKLLYSIKLELLTEGKPKVTDIVTLKDINENYLLQIAATAEKGSEHPLGEAIVKEAEERKSRI